MLASYRENIGKAHNYQKLAVCTACTPTSIPNYHVHEDLILGVSEPLCLSIVQF